jgi:hypothetical protein
MCVVCLLVSNVPSSRELHLESDSLMDSLEGRSSNLRHAELEFDGELKSMMPADSKDRKITRILLTVIPSR